MTTTLENMRVVREVVGVFNALRISYALGGSMASSVFGVPRFTQDADFMVEPFQGREQQFVVSFGSDYYLSLAAVRDALRRAGSFNIIQTRIGFKIDVFVRKDRPFDRQALERRLCLTMPDQPDLPLQLLSPEDVILFKLEWYRLGNETSDRQWSDILGVLRVQGTLLDRSYLRRLAQEIGVEDLLTKAFSFV